MAPGRSFCRFDPLVQSIAMDTLFLIVVEALLVIGLAKILHIFLLRRYNQPSAVSQIIAGIVVGSMGLHEMIVHVEVKNVEDTYGRYLSEVRILYMFFVGLQTDLAALRNDKRRCTVLTYATLATCLFLAAAVSGGMYGSMMHTPVRTPELLAAVLMLTLANTSCVAVSCMAGELRLMATESGRLVVAAATATNIICIIGEGVFSCTRLTKNRALGYGPTARLGMGILALLKVAVVLAMMPRAVATLNRRNVGRHHIGNWELVLVLVVVSYISNSPQEAGFNGMPTGLVLGLAFPREGPAARTIVDVLEYPLNAVLMPFYFGTMGMRLDFNSISGAIIVPATILTFLSLIGKVAGAMAAAAYLNLPLADAMRFAVLLNVKGHIDIIDMNFARSEGIWAEQALFAMIAGSIISTAIAGPVFAAVFRKEKEAYARGHQALESLGPHKELRMLACVHSARAAPGMLSLVELLSSAPAAQPTTHVLHFFDVVRKHAAHELYHQRVQDNGGQDDYGGDAIGQVNNAVDVFTCATGLAIRQIDAADLGTTVDGKLIRRCAEDARAGLLLVSHHKEQRYDGEMICRRDDHLQLNLAVLANAPCTVGILLDRPFRRGGTSFQLPTSISTSTKASPEHSASDQKVVTHVAAVFLGGPDDREAAAFACRLAKHPTISLTLIRFVRHDERKPGTRISATAADFDGEVAMMVHCNDADWEADADEDFLTEFRRTYAAKEVAAYVEKPVDAPTDVVEVLRGMAGSYALVVAGRGGRQPAELVGGLDGWGECKAMGPVGEILASNGSLEAGSVLVMQQKAAVSPLPPYGPALPQQL